MQFSCNPTVDVQLINVTPSHGLMLIGTIGIKSPAFTHYPSTGIVSITGLELTGPLSYGVYHFELHESGHVYPIDIYIIDCCIKMNFDVVVINDNLINVGTYFASSDILVLDEMTVNANASFAHCNIYFGADAKVTIEPGYDLDLSYTNLLPYCDFVWDGIFASQSNTKIELDYVSVTGSAQGFKLSDNVDFVSDHVTYQNNYYAISLFHFSASGPYANASFVELDGNTFNINGPNLPFASNTAIDMTAYTNYTNNYQQAGNGGVFLYVDDSEVQIGYSNLNVNSFAVNNIDDVVAIYSDESFVRVANNSFTDCRFAILAIQSRLDFGGSVVGLKNTVNASGIESHSSSQLIRFNEFNLASNVYIVMPTDLTIDAISGTKFYENDFTESFVTINGIGTRHVNIDLNWFNESYLTIQGISSTSIGHGVIVANNDFFSQLNTQNYSLKLIGTHSARVADNDFLLSPFPIPPPVLPYYGNHGLYLENVENGQIKSNVFWGRDYAICGNQSLDQTLISCNYFDETQIGILLNGNSYQGVLLSDQGNVQEGVENEWNDLNSMYGNSIARIKADFTIPFNYHFTGAPLTQLDPWGGVGVLQGAAAVFSHANASNVIADCNVLNKNRGTENEPNSSYFEFFPNPNNGVFTFKVKKVGGLFKVYSMDGVQVFFKNINTPIDVITVSIPVGIYMAVYEIDSRLETSPIVIN